jgi:hypothetical protein
MRVYASRALPREYQLWNEEVADHFFPSGATFPVYLDPDTPTLAEIGAGISARGDAVSAFVDAVKETLDLQRPASFLRWHNEWFADWRIGRTVETPPVVGLLSLFVFASTQMDNDRDYFRPLAELLDVPNSDGFRHEYNDVVRYYWSELNRWIESAKRGIPTAYPTDIRANVSLLLTQRFLSAAERGMLPGFFADTGLAPGTAMTETEMIDHIRRHVHLLPEELKGEWRRHSDRFAEVSCIELESWTGSGPGAEDRVEAPLLLGMYVDDRRSRVQFPLAVSSASAPGGDYFIEGTTAATAAIVAETGGRFSFDADREVVRFAQGARLSADSLAELLREDVELASAERSFRLRRKPTKLVLFLPIRRDSYLEAPARRAPLGSRFTLLARDMVSREPAFRALVASGKPVTAEGIPPGWVLYRDIEVTSIPEPAAGTFWAAEIDRIAPAAQPAVIELRGGVALPGPTRAGQAWLAEAPPRLLIHGTAPDISVQLHLRPADASPPSEETLTARAGDEYVRANSTSPLPPGDHLLFALSGTRVVAHRRLRLVSGDTPRIPLMQTAYSPDAPGGTSSGTPAPGTPTVRGALWADLPERNVALGAPPPAALSRIAPAVSESEDLEALGPLADIRPDRHRQRQKRRTAKIYAITGTLLKDQYAAEIADAVSEHAKSFASDDGVRYRIKYFDDRGEISISPEGKFVPLERFRVEYD